MTDADRHFHEQWLGMAQPSEGLVVSLPVLVDAQCVEKLPREAHVRFLVELVEDGETQRIASLPGVLEHVLELAAERFDERDAIQKEVSLYVPEGKQQLRPTRALKWNKPPEAAPGAADATPASVAARPYAMLVWEVPPEVTDLDEPETVTGTWEYPAQAKMERLLRECRVPIGLLTNGWELRLVYAPHGESSGWVAFRVADMASVSGRPIFDAFVMLLGRQRWFGVAPERQLPAILVESRKRNADVTNELSRQVFEALEVLLAGFAAADERDGSDLLRAALEREDAHLYAGLLAVLLRLVFVLYCEDRALLPVEDELFEAHYSLLGLFDELEADQGKYPDTMHRRFGAYPRLVSLFRAVFLGVKHGKLEIPPRRGGLFDPNTYPFLEGWGPEGSAPINAAEARASVRVPSVDDGTVFTVLHKLVYLNGQRLSYKALDVEQIGSVYEALMGFDVQRLATGAVRIRLGSKKGSARVWVEAERLLAVPKNQRQRWLQDELGFDKNVAAKIASAVAGANDAEAALTALEPLSGRRPERAAAGTLAIQPGPERRRTSSHYTPRELTEPIVKRTLDPLIKAIGEEPPSETLLNLVICDPAMGSGAFLVAACRYLADHVVAAWTREGKLEKIADAHEDVVNHARRLVAQRCLYGVDKNQYAVQLARLSLWLVTMARNEPFTFVDHALRHGDSLVGLSFDQLKAFHWKPERQVELSATLLKEALDEAIGIRQQIQELAGEGTPAAQREKEKLLFDAEDAIDRVRLIGDLVVGAFFAEPKEKARQRERDRRLDLVAQWLLADKSGEGDKASDL
ncbi:MAG TPA: DNA methyltransferase, partial [Polyangiaceae bacterium]